jgi:hypothetical protein
VHTVSEEIRQDYVADLNEERQEQYERVVKEIMTWKRQVASYIWELETPHLLFVEKDHKFFQAMRLQPVRAFLTPYLFAKFTPPWYYNDPHGHPPSLHMPLNPTREMQEYKLFLQQYGEGGCVVTALLKAAFLGRGEGSNSATKYPHPHMLELPAIAGMEPFHIWQVIRQLNELLVKLHVSLNDEYIMQSYTPLSIDLTKRHDAHLLMAQVDPDFPDAAQLRSWWNLLSAEDIKLIGRRRDLLVNGLSNRYKWIPSWAEGQVRGQLAKYKEEKRRQIGQNTQTMPVQTRKLEDLWAQTMPVQTTAGMRSLPYALERMWYRCDEITRTYLIARACDWVTYGDLVADRTFPQPTLPGIPPQEVSAAVAVLIDLLLQALAQESANRERAYAQRVDELVQVCLWKRDGLLHLEVYQAEGRVHMRQTVERSLPARVLTTDERKRLTDACSTELAHANRVLETLNDFVTFCQLLRQPENHVRTATQVYVEREVNTYTTAEMTNQMVQELINLYPHSAYVKSTWKGKIQTLDVSVEPGALLTAGRGELVDARRIARQDAERLGILRRRIVIEEEIRERQSNWQGRGGDDQPPPTSTSDTNPLSLPTGRTQNDEEPPPTSSISEKAPEEKPPRNRDIGQQRTGQRRGQEQKSEQQEPKQDDPPAAFREKLRAHAKESLQSYEAKGWAYGAASIVLALKDKEAAKRILPQLQKESPDLRGDIGELIALIGEDIEAVEKLIQAYQHDLFGNFHAINMAVALPDKTIAKRLLRTFEARGDFSCILTLANKLYDSDAIERLMERIEREGLYRYDFDPRNVRFNPERGKRFLQKALERNDIHTAGSIAAVLGETKIAKECFKYCRREKNYRFAGRIAALGGDISAAEKIIQRLIKDRDEHGVAKELIGLLAPHSPDVAYRLMQELANRGNDIGEIAAHLLEYYLD